MPDFDTAFSPCPNDTFIFSALVNGLVYIKEHTFNPIVSDVETLNRAAFQGKYPITKLSFHAYLRLKNKYTLLQSGAALGHGCGPLLVAKRKDIPIGDSLIAVPGEFTTAYLLLLLREPGLCRIAVEPFNTIMQGVAEGRFDAGLVIHEGRFLYPGFGLEKVMDLGEWWAGLTGAPIPLGCMALRKDFDINDEAILISSAIRSSIEYAGKHPEDVREFIRSYAPGMTDEIIDKHIKLYVNDFSLELGDEGNKAVKILEDMSRDRGIIK